MSRKSAPVTLEALPRQDTAIFRLFGYRIWKLAALSGAPVIRLCEGRYGISRQAWSLLSIVASVGQIAPSDLAAQIGLDRPRASRAISALIKKGLLLRRRGQDQVQRFVLQLTPEGADLVRALYPQVRLVSDRILEGLDPQARARFEEALEVLTQHAARINAELFTDVRAHRGPHR
jgi:DNA-binding MarR family transcriptional regulator